MHTNFRICFLFARKNQFASLENNFLILDPGGEALSEHTEGFDPLKLARV